MPIIGQQSHAHFTPIAAAILQRITSSFIYKYNVTQSIFRVTKTSTHKYNINYLLSTHYIYFYHLNPSGPTGPTRLYLRAVINALPNLPTVEGSTLTPNKVVDAETVNRTLSLIKGGSQTSLVLNSNATTTLQRYYFSRFVSDTLSGISSITAQTWTWNFAVKESSTSAKFPASGTNQPVRIVGCVWRPSTQNTVGDIIDSNSNATIDEASVANETVQIATFSGTQVLGVQDGDVLCFEVWFEITQGAALSYIDTFYYDGTTVNTIKNSTVTSHASYVETPQGLVFGSPLARVTRPLIQKYNIIGRIRQPRIYKYNVTSRAALSRIYRYQIFQSAILTPDYKYNIIGRISKLSISKYNILVRKQAPKIFRYAINSRLLSSKIYKYTITARLAAPSSKVYKYNILNSRSLSRIYKYNITTAVHLLRIYKYNLTSRRSLSRIYRYNLTNRIAITRTFVYNLFETIYLESNYNYDLLQKVLSSRQYKYNLLAHILLSKVYKYNILIRLAVSRTLTLRYNILNLIRKFEIFVYNLRRQISLSRIYKYRIGEGAISLTETYIYNVTGRISKQSKYLYKITALTLPAIWKLTGQTTDFPGKLEDLIKNYIIINWSISDPSLGPTPIITSTSNPKQQAQINNFGYDGFRTYYLEIKEVGSNVITRTIRYNTYEFETPIEIDCYSRRLKKGEAFNELNNIINELMRIFATYQKEEIFGIQGITFDRITAIEKTILSTVQIETHWIRRFRIILHYYKQSVTG